jgi:hypothetical protein
VTNVGVVAMTDVEARRRQPRMAARGELHAIDLEEGTGHRMKAEGVAVLDDDTGRLAPDFDNEGFGHGWISWSVSTWSRPGASTMVEFAEVTLTRSKVLSCGINEAVNSSALILRTSRANMTRR